MANKQLYSNGGHFESFYNHAAKVQKLQHMTNIRTSTTITYIIIICLLQKHVQSYECAVNWTESDPAQLLHTAGSQSGPTWSKP